MKQTPHCPAGACWRASLPWLLLRMAPVAATALGEAPTKLAAMSDADPIFAAIEQHKEARAAYLAVMDVPGEDREIRAIEDACQQAEHDAFSELFATAPTTVVGMASPFRAPRLAAVGRR